MLEARKKYFLWLRQFYSNCVVDYFDGDQKYGCADDFMDDFSWHSWYLSVCARSGLADPMALAEEIIAMCSHTVLEWKGIIANVPKDHGEKIQLTLISKPMVAWGLQNPLGGNLTSNLQ
jgi:hypothetical protein